MTHGDLSILGPAEPLAEPGEIVADVPAAITAASAPRAAFCNRCGQRLASDSTDCPVCAERAARLAPPAAAISSDEGRASVRSALRLYFALLSVSVVLILYMAASDEPFRLTTEWAGCAAISLIALVWAIRWRRALGPLLREPGRPGAYVLAPILGSISFMVASFIVSMLARWAAVERLNYLDDYTAAGYGFGVAVLAICVQPAIFEELAFRGVIMSALGRALSFGETAIVSALLFGILHLSVPSLAHLTLLGLALAWLRRWGASLYPCMLMHFTHNLLVLLNEKNGWTPW